MDAVRPDTAHPQDHFSGMTFNKALFDALAIGIFVLDGKGRILSVNHEAARVLGWSEASCDGRLLHDLIDCTYVHPSTEENLCPVLRYLQTDARMELRRLCCESDRAIIPVEYKCIRFDMPIQVGVLFSFRDLSHQLQLERDHDRLASIPEESPFPIVEFDSEGNLILCQPSPHETVSDIRICFIGISRPLAEGPHRIDRAVHALASA